MKRYLEKFLKRKIELESFPASKLPIMYNGLYNVYKARTDNFEWIIAAPKQTISLKDLRTHMYQLENITSMNCAFYFENVTPYIRNALTEGCIPFIISNKEIYLPFTGIMLTTPKARVIKHTSKISFLTQKIVLTALYEKWQSQNVTQVAKAINVSKTSVARCFDEMESLNINLLELKGARRVITVNDDIKLLWEEIMPKLRNPIIKRFEPNSIYDTGYKSGISALSELTMLNDNKFPTYGILKKDIRSLGMDLVNDDYFAEKACEVHELGYVINFQGKNVMDPFSIILSLNEEEAADDRVQIAIDEMLEEYIWS